MFIVSWLSAIPLFLLKDSYDYRFVLWLPMLAFAARLASDGRAGEITALARAMLCCFAFAAFVELACTLAASAGLPPWVEAAFVLGKHACMWTFVFASGIVMLELLRANLMPDPGIPAGSGNAVAAGQ